MFPFGKKKEDEEEEVLESDLPPKSKFRDLKPQNKRTRKEPVKPWGKSERMLILAVLGITVGISVILGAIARGKIDFPKMEFKSGKIEIPEISDGQIFTFEKKKNADCCEAAVKNFRDLTDNLVGDYSFYVIRLDDSADYGLNENDSLMAASLIKLPTIVTLYKEAENGNINLDEEYTLKDSDKLGGNGVLGSYKAGTKFTYRKLSELSLNISDNTAFNIIENLLGDRKIQEEIGSLGMKNTSIYDNLTSAKDMAIILKMLYNAEILNAEDSRELIGYMENTPFNSWIVAGVPEDIVVSHKYGREIRVVNDAAIVKANKPYVLVIMSGEVNELEVDEVFRKFSQDIFQFESLR